MASLSRYEPVLSSRSTSALIGLTKSGQRKVTGLLLRLAEHPHQIGDYTTRGDGGHDIQHLRLGEFRISFWADDAVRELRVVDITRLV